MCCWCSNQVSWGAVIFKSDTGDPPHLRGVIMHQSAKCISKLPVMVCALGFIFPIKSANYMIILCTVPRPFWKRIVLFILFFHKDNSASGKPAYAVRILMSVALSHTVSPRSYAHMQRYTQPAATPAETHRRSLVMN